eukprot:ctg_2867.g482
MGVSACSKPPSDTWSWLPGIITVGRVNVFITSMTPFRHGTGRLPRVCQKSPKNTMPASRLTAQSCTVRNTSRHVCNRDRSTCRSLKTTYRSTAAKRCSVAVRSAVASGSRYRHCKVCTGRRLVWAVVNQRGDGNRRSEKCARPRHRHALSGGMGERRPAGENDRLTTDDQAHQVIKAHPVEESTKSCHTSYVISHAEPVRAQVPRTPPPHRVEQQQQQQQHRRRNAMRPVDLGRWPVHDVRSPSHHAGKGEANEFRETGTGQAARADPVRAGVSEHVRRAAAGGRQRCGAVAGIVGARGAAEHAHGGGAVQRGGGGALSRGLAVWTAGTGAGGEQDVNGGGGVSAGLVVARGAAHPDGTLHRTGVAGRTRAAVAVVATRPPRTPRLRGRALFAAVVSGSGRPWPRQCGRVPLRAPAVGLLSSLACAVSAGRRHGAAHAAAMVVLATGAAARTRSPDRCEQLWRRRHGASGSG